MPATEKTWYNQKTMHVVFGFTSIAMLLATLLMFAKDHNRSWKGYQRRFPRHRRACHAVAARCGQLGGQSTHAE